MQSGTQTTVKHNRLNQQSSRRGGFKCSKIYSPAWSSSSSCERQWPALSRCRLCCVCPAVRQCVQMWSLALGRDLPATWTVCEAPAHSVQSVAQHCVLCTVSRSNITQKVNSNLFPLIKSFHFVIMKMLQFLSGLIFPAVGSTT